MTGIGDRVREARKRKKLSQAELARQTGMTQQAIGAIEAGRAQKSLKLMDLSRALDTTPEWLEGRDGAQDPGRDWTPPPVHSSDGLIEIDRTEYARLPVYDIRFAAGAGAQNYEEDPIDYHLMSMSFLRTLTDAPLKMVAIFQASGDSMETTINDRDWVMVDMRRTNLASPGIYALVCEGEGLLKRAAKHLETGAVTLISDNAKYEAQTIKKPDRLHVVGRVFCSLRRH